MKAKLMFIGKKQQKCFLLKNLITQNQRPKKCNFPALPILIIDGFFRILKLHMFIQIHMRFYKDFETIVQEA